MGYLHTVTSFGTVIAFPLLLAGTVAWVRGPERTARRLLIVGGIAAAAPILGVPILMAQETAQVNKYVGMLKDYLTLLGIVVGGGYFLIRLQFQKTFQRLSCKSSVTRIGTSNLARLLVTITNDSDVRINFGEMRYATKFLSIDASHENESSPGGVKDFRKNLVLSVTRNEQTWSVDAKSTTQFCEIISVPENVIAVDVTIAFSPQLTTERYEARDVFSMA